MTVFVALLPPALLLVGLRRRFCLGPWAFPSPLCVCSWALRGLPLCRSRWLPCSERCPSWLSWCLLLRRPWGPSIAYTLARGCSSAPCATAGGRFLACCFAAPSRSLLRALSVLIVVPPFALLCSSRCCTVADAWARERSFSLGVAARWRFAAYHVAALDGSSSPCDVFLGLFWLMCGLWRCCSWGSAVGGAWAQGRSSAPCATARARFAAYRSIALGRSIVSYAWAPGRSPARCAAAHGRIGASAIFPDGRVASCLLPIVGLR